MKLEFVQLSAGNVFFFEGVNYGDKLFIDPKKTKNRPLELTYDTGDKVIYVSSQGKTAIIPTFSSATVWTENKDVVTHVSHPQQSGIAVKAQVGGPNEVRNQVTFSAQVETPMDKVQGKPGRKAKFQGENQGE